LHRKNTDKQSALLAYPCCYGVIRGLRVLAVALVVAVEALCFLGSVILSSIRFMTRLTAATLAAAMLAVALPAVVRGQAARPYAGPEAAALLPWAQQIAVREDWLTKRHALLLPMMRRHKVGMWIVVNE